uniref:Jacalin-type lectin domain-containing protein n=1 Tax=Tanacetum cinerariifolium TaxID=118510 RepID=A0A6L2JLX0_TANCI|nr:hypothetical protein [Tanacetum cinerariifolium]
MYHINIYFENTYIYTSIKFIMSVVRVGAWGGSGGTGQWTYLVPASTRLQQIQVVTNGRCIYSIQFIGFNQQTNRLVNSELYGNDANLDDGTTYTVEIPNGQHLSTISGTFGTYQDLSNIITSLSFRVGRNLMEFGGKTGTTFSLPVNRGVIKGFFGNSGDYLDSLGVVIAPL